MDDMETIALSVVVPVFNEEEIIEQMSVELAAHFDRIVGEAQWQFVYVENGSRDRTPEIIKDLSDRWPLTAVFNLPQANYGDALRKGIVEAQAPWVHVINIEQWDMYFFEWAWKHREHYDLIIGSKLADPTLNQQSIYRRFLSWGLNSILRLNFEYVGADTHGPKLLRMSTMVDIVSKCVMSRGQFDTEIVLRSVRDQIRIAEAPTEYIEHRAPRNFMIRKVLQNLWDQVALYRAVAPLPYQGHPYFHRYARHDLETQSGHLPGSGPDRGETRDGT